ncbi:MAG: AMP-binding protein [Anaerolineales bacterium]|nr:AMP-binding protein [Anaerolineales bacterium]
MLNHLTRLQTLTQAMMERAALRPDQPAVIFIHDDGREETVTVAQFHARAAGYAQALQFIGVQPEDLVVLVLKHSQTLLYAFWGAMYLGAIGSIFPFLTEKLDAQIYMERVRELVTHSRAKAAITFPEFKKQLSDLLKGVDCAVLCTEDVPEISNAQTLQQMAWPMYDGEKIAFLQHSSGTTGLQKGVALSHRAVLNQIEAYQQAIDLQPDDVIISWLPLYHDMGLIAGFVMPLVAGVPLVLMSPFKWVRDPKTLFHAIHRHRGTLCWLPNFAYNHCARVIRSCDIEGVDLSSMRAFINCSEPVFFESHQVFLEKFAAHGVRPEALSTCYAMAENTFAVTQFPIGQMPTLDWVHTRTMQEQRRALPAQPASAGSTPMVSCGFPIPNTDICILDDNGLQLPERRIGEVALRSNCMLSGYYHRPDLTTQAMRDGWYYTGDMGYIANGELYITGRKKDLIIHGGKNIYPQDLEAIANTIPGITPGRSVAFGLMDKSLGSEKIIMICELDHHSLGKEEQHNIEMELRKRVVQRSEVALADVRLVGKRWLIKTSSGKIARAANREKYLREFLGEEQS